MKIVTTDKKMNKMASDPNLPYHRTVLKTLLASKMNKVKSFDLKKE